jgi:hypothetical protein
MGKKARIEELETELRRVNDTNQMLKEWRELWLTGLTEEEQSSLHTSMGALHSLFHKLNVQHMTGAVMEIEALQKRPQQAAHNSLVLGLKQDLADYKFHLDNARARIAGLINQQHGKDASAEQHGWDMANLKARNGELEEALRHVSEILVADLIEDIQFEADYFSLHSICQNLVSHIAKMDVFPPATEEGEL